MTTPAALRAVKPGEKAPAKAAAKKSVAEAAESGTHRDLLVAMRDRIARAVADPKCPPRDLAALSRRLQDIAKEIDALDAEAEQEAKENAASPDEEFDAASV